VYASFDIVLQLQHIREKCNVPSFINNRITRDITLVHHNVQRSIFRTSNGVLDEIYFLHAYNQYTSKDILYTKRNSFLFHAFENK